MWKLILRGHQIDIDTVPSRHGRSNCSYFLRWMDAKEPWEWMITCSHRPIQAWQGQNRFYQARAMELRLLHNHVISHCSVPTQHDEGWYTTGTRQRVSSKPVPSERISLSSQYSGRRNISIATAYPHSRWLKTPLKPPL